MNRMMEEDEHIETMGAVGPDEPAEYAAETIQQLNKDYFSELWRVKWIEATIKETQQRKEVTKITLDMINDSLKEKF